jgi:hypothetical protein
MIPITSNKGQVMLKREAILLTKDNAPAVAATLTDYTLEELLAEADPLFTLNGTVVLCASTYPTSGHRLVDYVVHESLYKINNDNFAALNDKTYVPVSTI